MDALEIKNLALFELGYSTDEASGSKTMNIVDKIYDIQLQETLDEYDWNFQQIQGKLTSPTTLTDEYFKYQYELPSDYSRFVNAYKDSNRKYPIVDFAIDQRLDTTIKNYIYSTVDAGIYVVYISNDLTNFYDYIPQRFVDYFALTLAGRLCMNLTGDTDLLQTIEARRDVKRKLAYKIDNKQVKTKRITYADKYLNKRRY